MPDSLGPVPIPDPPLVDPFPLVADFGSGQEIPERVVSHLMDQPGLKTEQRFFLGDGARRFRVRKYQLSCGEYETFKTHWESARGVHAEFDYEHPTSESTFQTYRVRYADTGITLQHTVDLLLNDPGIVLVECPQATPTLVVGSELERFPDAGLTEDLRSQVQRVIPLINIHPHQEIGAEEPPDTLYLSDRRVNINGISGDEPDRLYLPRLLEWDGISQSIGENSDTATFTFGNADQVWFDYTNQIDLTRARVEFWLFFKGPDTLLKLWTGYIEALSFSEDGNLEVQAADGVYELNLPYPVRQISRTCWKEFNDGSWCPYAAEGIDNPDTGEAFLTCNKSFEDCTARGMTRYFGGQQANAQTIRIKDNSTGTWGFGRSTITSVTVRSDTVYQRVLQEIYTDTYRNPLPEEPPPEDWKGRKRRKRLRNGVVYDDPVPIPKKLIGPPVPVIADISEGRDESEFFAAIGILGEGPLIAIHADNNVHLLDKKGPEDPKKNGGGIRFVPGRDPADESHDFYGLNQAPWFWPVRAQDATPTLPEGTPAPPGSTYAAGTAFAEMRRVDEEGIQAAPMIDREMLVQVTKGLGGWVWTGVGGDDETLPTGPYTRKWSSMTVGGEEVPGPLTNPVWIAVNVYLRGLGLRTNETHADVITVEMMEALFDVEAAVSAAWICDLKVKPMLGLLHPDQKEIQFAFRGILKEQKPLRDWLQEILNTCLGYYTFSSGKLRIGIRFHSGTDTGLPLSKTFTIANILHKSLRAEPVLGKFNYLAGEFGDEEFDWQLNKVVVYDIDNARFYGTQAAPRYTQSQMSFVGVSSKSQCARLVTTRLREELGGATREEQRNARNISIKTTVLALEVHPGDICSLNHPRLPNEDNRVEFRVVSWRLNPDWSIDISGSSTCNSMYDYVFGPKPEDEIAAPVPAEVFASALGVAWLPNELAPFPDDPLVPPTELTFSLQQAYPIEAEGTYSPAVIVRGEVPVNRFLEGNAPAIRGIETFPEGGSLKGGSVYYFAVAQRNGEISGDPIHVPAGEFGPPSNIAAIWVPHGTDTNRVVLDPIQTTETYPGYGLWVGDNIRTLSQQIDDASGALPEEITFTYPLALRTRGLPNAQSKRVRIKCRDVYHAGVAGIQVQEVIAPNIIKTTEIKGSDDPWVGRYLSVIADASDLNVPLWNFTITAFDPVEGSFTVTPDCVRTEPENSVQEGDVMIVRARAEEVTTDKEAGTTTIKDSLWANDVGTAQFNAVDGLIPGYEAGLTFMVVHGKGKGTIREIIANDHLTHTVKPPLITPFDGSPPLDETSVYIITWSDWPYIGESVDLDVHPANTRVVIVARVTNSYDQEMLVGGFLIDTSNRETFEQFGVYREIYVYGEPYHVRTVTEDEETGKYVVEVEDQTLRVDTTDGDQNVELLPVESYFGRKLLVVNDGAGPSPGRVKIKPMTGEELQNGAAEVVLEAPGDWVELVAAGDREEERAVEGARKAGRIRSWSRRKPHRGLGASTRQDLAQWRRTGPMPPPDRKGQI
jgi:hypothetical protein